MQSINRMVAVIKPKKPYLDWINSLPGMNETPIDIEEHPSESSCFLIPQYDTIEQGREFVWKNAKKIFEVELGAWDLSGEYWPVRLDRSLFKEFFEVDIHSEVIDMMKGPIEREDY